jgi:hypothetical protein
MPASYGILYHISMKRTHSGDRHRASPFEPAGPCKGTGIYRFLLSGHGISSTCSGPVTAALAGFSSRVADRRSWHVHSPNHQVCRLGKLSFPRPTPRVSINSCPYKTGTQGLAFLVVMSVMSETKTFFVVAANLVGANWVRKL